LHSHQRRRRRRPAGPLRHSVAGRDLRRSPTNWKAVQRISTNYYELVRPETSAGIDLANCTTRTVSRARILCCGPTTPRSVRSSTRPVSTPS
jgi:hypothetical protein